MTRILAAALIPLALAACSPGEKAAAPDAAGAVQVAGALCRPTPPGRQVSGCYLTLTAPTADRLTAVSTPAAGRAQVHESKMESNMMMMHELKEGLPLPAGQAVELRPGGNHIMLLGVKGPLRPGDTVPLTLTFASGASLEVTAAVGQPATSEYDHLATH
jgi:copper(I)-binding protein